MHGGRPLAIVADDDANARALVVRLLERHGFRVREARDGEHALYLCRWTQPVLVISDNRMPDMSGAEFLRQVGDLPFGFRVRRVVFSANPDECAQAADFVVEKAAGGLGRLEEVVRLVAVDVMDAGRGSSRPAVGGEGG